MNNCPLGVTPMKLIGKLLTTECKENTKIKQDFFEQNNRFWYNVDVY